MSGVVRIFFGVCALAPLLNWAGAREPWRDATVSEINRLPARTLLVPCESAAVAVAIAEGREPPERSAWVMRLDGTWDFAWKREPARAWEKTAKIAVPSCWQLQGEYDPPLYNTRYPLAGFAEEDPMTEPPKEWTAYEYRNPIGLYTTSFTLPAAWTGRRVVLRFLGVSSAFYVRLNGRLVGYGEDARLPSEFDLTPYLAAAGAQQLAVEVYKHSDGTYLEDQDFWRLSGIYRSVFLVSEAQEAPRDLVVDTTLAEDFSAGSVTFRAEDGRALEARTVAHPRLWSPENPALYTETLVLGGDYHAVSYGFRRVDIRDGQLLLNGKRIVFNGVNRHEMSPTGGYTLTWAEQLQDVEVLKRFNFNAVRTSHYPNLPEWYGLCDRAGLMLVSEANVESHGAGWDAQTTLAANPRYRAAHVERNVRMVRFFRNHPSVLSWSLGNEAGMGPNFEAAYRAVKALDPTRPVQYWLASKTHRGEKTPFTDVNVQMYPHYIYAADMAKALPGVPHLMQECAHAMGNSLGDFSRLWAVADEVKNFQGGFIWDFADQAIWKADAKGRFLAYGGDFGDVPNKANVMCNGVFDALRNPHPGAYEVKHVFQGLSAFGLDWTTGVFRVKSRRVFEPLADIGGRLIVEREGRVLYAESLDVNGLGPGEERAFTCDLKGRGCGADAVRVSFTHAGEEVAWDQFMRPFVPRAVPAGTRVATHPFKLNFWRVPVDNDRGWKMAERCQVWKDATASQQLPPGVTSDLKVTRDAEGAYYVDWLLTVPEGLPPIPRVGLSFTLSNDERMVEWYGLGPWENYPDRATAAVLGRHRARIGLVSGYANDRGTIDYPADRLNPDNYSKPGEQGYRTGVRELKIGRVKVTALNAPFGFNAWPYTQAALEGPARVSRIHGAGAAASGGLAVLSGNLHPTDLAEGDAITINIDAVQMGIGGDDSWGAWPHDAYLPRAGRYRLAFRVEGPLQ